MSSLVLSISLVPASLLALTAGGDELEARLIFPLQPQHTHSASLVELPNGDLLACWFQGSGERKANDVVIRGARLRRGADAWSEPFELADTPNLPDCNPILFLDAQDRLHLMWIAVIANRWEHSLLRYCVSEDYEGDGPPRWNRGDVLILEPGDGFRAVMEERFKELGVSEDLWAEYALPYTRQLIAAAEDPIKRQLGWMTRIRPITLESGRMVLPLYSDGFNAGLVALSDDGGASWGPGGAIIGLGPIQPSITQRSDGALVAFCRQSGHPDRAILRAMSFDEGETWTPAVPTDLPNPDASVQTLALADGRWLLVYNDTREGRASLAAALSDDEGETWGPPRPLERGDASYSYATAIQTRDGRVHVVYSVHTSDGKAIKHASFPPDWPAAG